jgi:hypothetical protein
MQDGMNNGMKSEMKNIKANGDKFLVEIKTDLGGYEPLGVLSFREAVEMQFTTHRAVRFQRISGIPDAENPFMQKVAPQEMTRADLCRAVAALQAIVCSEMPDGRMLSSYGLIAVSTSQEPRDPGARWPGDTMEISVDAVSSYLSGLQSRIEYGSLDAYFKDADGNVTPVPHGIVIRNGRVANVY